MKLRSARILPFKTKLLATVKLVMDQGHKVTPLDSSTNSLLHLIREDVQTLHRHFSIEKKLIKAT